MEDVMMQMPPGVEQLLLEMRQRKRHLLRETEQLKNEMAQVTAEMEKSNPVWAEQHSVARAKFNSDQEKGIDYLVEQGLVIRTPQSIATFLIRGRGLSKTAVGEYLSQNSPFHEQIRNLYVDMLDFRADQSLVQALRMFLSTFRLPGEAQKIDRMMDAFARGYCRRKPAAGVFSGQDTCYVVSFALIMLNTSLHNPNVRQKMTLHQFMAMISNIDHAVPDHLLRNMYHDIRREALRMPRGDDDLTLTPVRQGWLWKQRGQCKTFWK